jgi:hypothetical protein
MTFIIIFIKANYLKSFATLNTLKVLNILRDLKAYKLTPEFVAPYVIPNFIIKLLKSTIESVTIVPSKTFILSLTYPNGLNAKFLRIISNMKTPVNTKSALKHN